MVDVALDCGRVDCVNAYSLVGPASVLGLVWCRACAGVIRGRRDTAPFHPPAPVVMAVVVVVAGPS